MNELTNKEALEEVNMLLFLFQNKIDLSNKTFFFSWSISFVKGIFVNNTFLVISWLARPSVFAWSVFGRLLWACDVQASPWHGMSTVNRTHCWVGPVSSYSFIFLKALLKKTKNWFLSLERNVFFPKTLSCFMPLSFCIKLKGLFQNTEGAKNMYTHFKKGHKCIKTVIQWMTLAFIWLTPSFEGTSSYTLLRNSVQLWKVIHR